MDTPIMKRDLRFCTDPDQEDVATIQRRSSSSHWSLHSSASDVSLDTFWRTPPKSWNHSRWGLSWGRKAKRYKILRLSATFVAILLFFVVVIASRKPRHHLSSNIYIPPQPQLSSHSANDPDPVKWLQENSNNRHSISSVFGSSSTFLNPRPRAALISLVRNSEVEGITQSMRQLEYRWNRKYQYPWIFFNDEPFSDDFKAATQKVASSKCYYEVIPKEHWSLPDWIDKGRFSNGLEYLGTIGVGKGWMTSYHHMCRWNSGFFYKHPALKDFDWYWRVEPHVHYYCDINYDVFRFVRDNDLKYGFNMNILDDARSFPSLWHLTKTFISSHMHLLHPAADLTWLLDPETGAYNNCQFFSNFEIGSLDFWRGSAPNTYFDFLDRSGGFFYERFGDAPVHTLSIAMFLPKKQTWWFRDIGYQHDINRQCPPRDECDCEVTSIDEGFYRLVPLESTQRKPQDTCVRAWLGGEWVNKQQGWSREAEVSWGGDGFGGYALKGDE